jgi:transcriptional regulator with XRE-family HTH domain
MNEKLHIGRKVARLRELRGIKQEALAEQLGVSQQAVSKLEQSENIEDTTLSRIAKALQVTPDAIKNFNEDAVFNQFTFNDHSIQHYQCTFNPLDEYRNEVKENKRLSEENKKLYESLLKEKDEKIALLKKMLEGR